MEDRTVADALSTQLAERIGRKRFDLWFKQQANITAGGERLIVCAVNAFVRDWIRAHFADDVRDCWQALVGPAGTVEFEFKSPTAVADGGQTLPDNSAPVDLRAERPLKQTTTKRSVAKHAVAVTADSAALQSPKNSLTSFVVGPSNEYAFRSAELTGRRRQQASPLLFIGPTGVGKTHLLRAIVQEFRSLARASALYLTAEQFTTSFVEAVRGSGLPSFRQKCRGVQLLAIDDLQFFAGKQRTLEELLYTLDTLTHDGRQIVLSSDRGLAELRALGGELISRLSGGLTCELSTPEFATRLGIVRQIASELNLNVCNDVATLIATQIHAGARELRGALLRLQAMSAADGQPIDRALAERCVDELARHNTRSVRLADVEKVVCSAFGVEPSQLRSDRKGRSISAPRMLAMWLARKYTRAALSEIGTFFGRNSHSTVISAQRRIEKMIADDTRIEMAHKSCHVDEAIRCLETALRTA